jgi:predicted DNA-binding transcriptional regulator YafY
MELLKSPKTRDELLDCLKKDIILKNECSKDSITNTINALRKVGCVISRPSLRTKNKYILKSHPFTKTLSKENIDALLTLRESITSLGDWQLLININNLYKKIANITTDKDSYEQLVYNHVLKNINLKILQELLISINLQKNLQITYYSPENGEERLEFIPNYISLENKKLYLWGYNKKYNNHSYLRIDRIRKINLIDFFSQEKTQIPACCGGIIVKYRLKGLSALLYIDNPNETIIEKNQEPEFSITIKETVNNKFNFFQKVLSYGTDCKILSPKEIQIDFLNTLKKIKSEYTHADR